ncbi:MAG: hypothetical protein LBE85_09730, partial [Candidatus Accumulibacter sp.]|nr:hypothetical protein [Accumulibacter sp.]
MAGRSHADSIGPGHAAREDWFLLPEREGASSELCQAPRFLARLRHRGEDAPDEEWKEFAALFEIGGKGIFRHTRTVGAKFLKSQAQAERRRQIFPVRPRGQDGCFWRQTFPGSSFLPGLRLPLDDFPLAAGTRRGARALP